MGKKEKKEFRNRLTVLLAHLIKWEYQPDYIGKRSWEKTIDEQRRAICNILAENPSLKPAVREKLEEAWGKAKESAEKETGVGTENFPHKCLWAFDQIMDDEFFPVQNSNTGHQETGSRLPRLKQKMF